MSNFGKRKDKAQLEIVFKDLFVGISSVLQKRIEETPLRYRLAYLKVLSGKFNSKSAALRMKCFECVNFEDTKSRITSCKTTSCPLWHFRPYKR